MEFSPIEPIPGDPLSATGFDSKIGKITDIDLTHDSPHHTIGYGPTQAAPGNDVLLLKKKVAALEAKLLKLEARMETSP